MEKKLKTLDRIIYYFETAFIAAGLSVMALSLIVQFLMGQLGVSMPWAGKLASNLMVWVTCIGASAATRNRSHIAIELVAGRLAGGARRALDTAVCVICVALCAGACAVGVSFVAGIAEVGRVIWELKLPVWIVYAALPVGFGLMAVRFALALVLGGEEEEGGSG